jgi:hypothetical protein
VLGDNLRQIGYTWVRQEQLPTDVLQKNIQVIEAATGIIIPRILIKFWEIIGGFSLVDLEDYQHVDFWANQGIIGKQGFCDGVYVEACSDEWAAYICDSLLDWQEFCAGDEEDKFFLDLSPDGFHKDNISGGAAYGVLGESQWKPIWLNFEWSGYIHPVSAFSTPPDFLSYLRTALLECAGFPGFLGLPAFDPIKAHLLHGVPLF